LKDEKLKDEIEMTHPKATDRKSVGIDELVHPLIGATLCATGLALDLIPSWGGGAGSIVSGALIISGLVGLFAGFILLDASSSSRRAVERAIVCCLVLAVAALFEYFIHGAVADRIAVLSGLSIPAQVAGGAGFALAVVLGILLPVSSALSRKSAGESCTSD